jgi:hypothetical protein
MNKTTIIAVVVTLVLGLAAGFFLGRWTLERQWRQPQMLLEGAEFQRLSSADADPVPAAGSRILRSMPLERSRVAMKDITKSDPVVLGVGAIGNGDEGTELHLDLVNNGRCTVTSVSGVAYGFDAWGEAAKLNKAGENFVAFSEDKIEIEPGKHHLVSSKLRYPETASLALAQVDSVRCKDAQPWSRK